MDLKSVNQNVISNRVNDSVRGQEKSGTAPSGSDAKTVETDKVTLTNVSQVKDLEAKAAASEVDNSARIAELKAAIKDGSYQVNAENVAKKLIQTETLIAGNG